MVNRALCFLLLLPCAAQAGPFDGWEHWWRTQTGMSPRYEAQLVHSTAATNVTGNASGGVNLNRGVSLTVKKAAAAGGGAARTTLLEMVRTVPKSAVVQRALPYAKTFGPWFVPFAVALIWNEVEERWETGEDVPTSIAPLGKWWNSATPTPPCGAAQGYYGTAEGACDAGLTCYNETHPTGKFTPEGYVYSSPSQVACKGRRQSSPYDLVTVTWANRVYACPAGTIYSRTSDSCVVPGVLPATDQQIMDAISNGVGVDPAKAEALADKVVAQEGEQALTEASTGPEVTGPAQSSPVTSTTTSTSGGITTVTTNTTVYNYTYEGDKVTVEGEETETICVDGVCDTTTDEYGGDEEVLEEEPEDFCTLNPDASGCAPLDVPPSEELGNETREIIWDSERTAAGSCPAPIVVPSEVLGQDIEFSYQPICDFVTWFRPIIIGSAWLSAGIYVFLMVRREVG